jgi:hypothetical protein
MVIVPGEIALLLEKSTSALLVLEHHSGEVRHFMIELRPLLPVRFGSEADMAARAQPSDCNHTYSAHVAQSDRVMSALPPKGEIDERAHVRFVPKADITRPETAHC